MSQSESDDPVLIFLCKLFFYKVGDQKIQKTNLIVYFSKQKDTLQHPFKKENSWKHMMNSFLDRIFAGVRPAPINSRDCSKNPSENRM